MSLSSSGQRARPRPVLLQIAAGLTLAGAALLFLALTAGAAGATTERIWTRQYAPTAGADQWEVVAKGPSGTVYVAGNRAMESEGQRAVVAKYTAGGKRLWVRHFTGLDGFTWVADLAVNGHGHVYLVGGERHTGGVITHIFVLKLGSADGAKKWVRRYVGPVPGGHDFATDVAVGPNGAVYVSGSHMGSADDYDALLLKYVDHGGSATRAWLRTYKNTGSPSNQDDDIGRVVAVDGKGRVFWGGSSREDDGSYAAFVRRVRVANGGAVWTRRFQVQTVRSTQLVDLALFPGGGIVAAGISREGDLSGNDAWVYRLTPTGTKRVFALVDSPDSENLNDLAVDGAGNIALAGQLGQEATGHTLAWVTRGDPLLANRWTSTYASSDPSQPANFESVATGPNGAVYCGGRANTGFITGYDFTMVKYSSTGTRLWVDAYDDLDANKSDRCTAILSVGGDKPGLYGVGYGGATALGEALLVKYQR